MTGSNKKRRRCKLTFIRAKDNIAVHTSLQDVTRKENSGTFLQACTVTGPAMEKLLPESVFLDEG